MYKTSTFRLHLIVFLWGFTAILGKLIHANAEVLVFYRMLFASVFLYLFIRIIKKDSIKIKELKNDDRVEKYAREKCYMKRDNEDIYIIEFEDEKKAAAEKTTSNN